MMIKYKNRNIKRKTYKNLFGSKIISLLFPISPVRAQDSASAYLDSLDSAQAVKGLY